jgi:hypothetical protein
MVAFIVLFIPGSDIFENGTILTAVFAFTVFLFVRATHPVASIHPTAINRANGTISFIGGSIAGRMILVNNRILQGTEALQFGFWDCWKKSRGT